MSIFTEVSMILLACAGIGLLAVQLRQPLMIVYIIIGVLAGPAGLGWYQASEHVELLAQIGIAVLLFLVGLRLDLNHLKNVGPVALATGLGQLTFTIIIGFLIVLALGWGLVEALYIAVALTFSSTIIIVKLLSDKRELDSLHGRIAIGFLIVQDIAVVVAMMVISALREPGGDTTTLWVLADIAGRIALAAIAMYVLMRYILPRVTHALMRSQELLMIFAIAWGTSLAALGDWAGFSKEAGAFLAGFSLASSVFRDALSSRLTGIRDFLLLFFFINLGAEMDLGEIGDTLGTVLILSAFVLIGNPLIVMAIMGYMGYRRRTGFKAGLTVAQISEFSIVFIAMGVTLGHVGEQIMGVIVLVGIITITVSTYLIVYSQAIYERIANGIRVFERRNPFRELSLENSAVKDEHPQVVVFGQGRLGGQLARQLHKDGIRVLGVDFDPEAVRQLRREGIPVLFGDAGDSDFLSGIPLHSASWIVTALADPQAARTLLQHVRALGFKGKIGTMLRTETEAAYFEASDVARVFFPFSDAASFAAEELAQAIRQPDVS